MGFFCEWRSAKVGSSEALTWCTASSSLSPSLFCLLLNKKQKYSLLADLQVCVYLLTCVLQMSKSDAKVSADDPKGHASAFLSRGKEAERPRLLFSTQTLS